MRQTSLQLFGNVSHINSTKVDMAGKSSVETCHQATLTRKSILKYIFYKVLEVLYLVSILILMYE